MLAHSLGGTTSYQFNYAPQTARLNRIALPDHSIWYEEEMAMRNFLSQPNRRIVWEIFLLRPHLQTNDPLRLRPTHFCLRHRNYNEHGHLVDNYNNSITQPQNVMVFSNDPNDECRYDEWYRA